MGKATRISLAKCCRNRSVVQGKLSIVLDLLDKVLLLLLSLYLYNLLGNKCNPCESILCPR